MTITATVNQPTGARSGTASLTVTLVPVASVVVYPSPDTIWATAPLNTVQLNDSTKDAGGNNLPNRPVTWTPTSGGVATVNASGLATSTNTAAGSATITATASNGPNASGTVVVLGHSQTVNVIQETPGPLSLSMGPLSVEVYATILDSFGNDVSAFAPRDLDQQRSHLGYDHARRHKCLRPAHWSRHDGGYRCHGHRRQQQSGDDHRDDDRSRSCRSHWHYVHHHRSVTVIPRSSRLWVATLLVLAAQLATARVGAQVLPLKRPDAHTHHHHLPHLSACRRADPAVDHEASRLATLGQESALEGDHRAARDLFAQAAQLNPRDPALAYRLGREYEETGQKADALRQYCRYLALAPNGPDAPQVTGRAAQLVPEAALTRGTELVEQFHTGVAHFDAKDWSTAVQSFGQVVAGAPAFPPAIYNLAVSHDRQGNSPAAIRDYSRYLSLVPQAEDADSVRARMQTLRQAIPSPGAAFAIGLLPGGGQSTPASRCSAWR